MRLNIALVRNQLPNVAGVSAGSVTGKSRKLFFDKLYGPDTVAKRKIPTRFELTETSFAVLKPRTT